MQIIGGPSYNPATGSNEFTAGSATTGGVVIMHNMSPYDLVLTFGEDPSRQGIIHAWQPRKFDFCGKQTNTIAYSIYFTPPPQIIAAAPSSYLYGESFAQGETIPESLPNYDRISNIGNSIMTSSPQPLVPYPISISSFIYSASANPSNTGNVIHSPTIVAFVDNGNGGYVENNYSAQDFTVPAIANATFYIYGLQNGLLLFGQSTYFVTNPPPVASMLLMTAQTGPGGTLISFGFTPLSAFVKIFGGMSGVGGIEFVPPVNIDNVNGVHGDVSGSGSMGIPLIVQADNEHVTSTAGVGWQYFGNVAGLYRFGFTLFVNNGTNGNKISANLQFDYKGSMNTIVLQAYNLAGTLVTLNGVNVIPNGVYTGVSIMIPLDNSISAQFTYTDPTNTPNDYEYSILERLI